MDKYIVIIIREGVPELFPFDDLVNAAKYADKAGQQWSDTYVCKVLSGPKV